MTIVTDASSNCGPEDATTRFPEAVGRRDDGTGQPRPTISKGRYVVIEEIGRGGMGQVVRAYDPKLRREIALKRLKPNFEEADGEARLVREAQAMAQLSHPNVVAVFDVDVDADGVNIAMEYVPGCTLRKWLKQPRAPHQILNAFTAAGRGLMAAHKAGLVHRDFKPSNVLVTDDGRIKVTDFGLAKPVGRFVEVGSGAPCLDSELTEAGSVMGTPRYMAPEQRRGEHVDARADQYSFCVALWEALVGQSPFSKDALANVELRQAPQVPKDTRAPAAVLAALLRGLQPDGADRWPSMSALLDAFEHAERRRRVLRTAGYVAPPLLTLVALGVWSQTTDAVCTGATEQIAEVWAAPQQLRVQTALQHTGRPHADATWSRVRAGLTEYAQGWVTQHTQTCLATTVRREQSSTALDLRMACLQRAKGRFTAAVDLLGVADGPIADRAVQLVEDLPLLGRCHDAVALGAEVLAPDATIIGEIARLREDLAAAHALRSAGHYDRAHAIASPLYAEAESLGYAPFTAEVGLLLGEIETELGDFDKGLAKVEAALMASLQYGPRTLAVDAASTASFMLGRYRKSSDEALWVGKVALGLAIDRGDASRLAHVHNALGTIYDSRFQFPEAAREFGRAIDLLVAEFGSQHLQVAGLRTNFGGTLSQQGEYEAAEEQLRMALSVTENALGPEHPGVALVRNGLGLLLQNTGALAEAEQEFREALKIWRGVFEDDNNLVIASSHANLGNNLGAQGKPRDARRYLELALAGFEHTFGPSHPSVGRVNTDLGKLDVEAGSFDGAQARARLAYDTLEDVLGPDQPETMRARLILARALVGQGRLGEAKPHLESLVASEPTVGADHTRARAGLELAKVLQERGAQLDRAQTLARTAIEGFAEIGSSADAERREAELWLSRSLQLKATATPRPRPPVRDRPAPTRR